MPGYIDNRRLVVSLNLPVLAHAISVLLLALNLHNGTLVVIVGFLFLQEETQT